MLTEQMELQLEEPETAASEDELAAEKAAARTQGAPLRIDLPALSPQPKRGSLNHTALPLQLHLLRDSQGSVTWLDLEGWDGDGID
jgi:hypothetical protein